MKNMKTIIFDSSIWIASLLKEDIFNAEAKRMIARYLKKSFSVIIPQPVLVEVINVVLRQKLEYKEVLDFIKNITTTRNINLVYLNNDVVLEKLPSLSQRLFIKSQDILIILYCEHFKPSQFETFDLKQRNCYNSIN